MWVCGRAACGSLLLLLVPGLPVVLVFQSWHEKAPALRQGQEAGEGLGLRLDLLGDHDIRPTPALPVRYPVEVLLTRLWVLEKAPLTNPERRDEAEEVADMDSVHEVMVDPHPGIPLLRFCPMGQSRPNEKTPRRACG